MIITDGNCHDIRCSIDALVECSNYPVSIIVIGVGDHDFSGMEFLDSDDRLPKDSRNNEAVRDILQFVPFDDFRNVDGTIEGD